MKDEYDLSTMTSRHNPYAAKLERQVTISMGGDDVVGQGRTTSEVKTFPWDAADHLKTPEDMALHLEAAFDEGDGAVIAMALGTLARVRGVTWMAEEVGLTPESLSESLSTDGNPKLATVLEVVAALGLRLHVAPASDTGTT